MVVKSAGMKTNTFRVALEADVTQFYLKAMVDPTVAGYLSLGPHTYIPQVDATVGHWNSVYFTNDRITVLGSLHISRSSRNDVSIAGFALDGNSFLAGKLVLFMIEQARLIGPHAVTSTVLATNEKSMRLTERLLGKPWGLEPDAGWDGVLGRWVDIAHFRRSWEDMQRQGRPR